MVQHMLFIFDIRDRIKMLKQHIRILYMYSMYIVHVYTYLKKKVFCIVHRLSKIGKSS